MALWWLGATALQVLLLVLSLPAFLPGLGVPTWHHHASLAAAAAFGLAFPRRMTEDRRFLGVGVLVTTVLALASAFLLLYLKDPLKDTGLKDWAKWWHVAWSWFALAFFMGHTWANRKGLLRSLRRLNRTVAGAGFYLAVLVVIVLLVPLTWSPWGAAAIHEGNYIGLTHYTWLAFLVPAYGAWLYQLMRARAGHAVSWATRPKTQAFVDGWLTPMTILATVTGFPILYFGTKDTDLKHVAKYWHTWPSIAMAILVFAHGVQFWVAMRAHLKARDGRA